MNLLDRLAQDMKEAMKAGEKDCLRVLRSVLADLRNAGIEKGGGEAGDDSASRLDETDQISVLRSAVKRRKEAATQYREGGREEHAAVEEAEVEVIVRYLPAAMPEEELDALVAAAVQECGASEMADMGKVMQAVLPKVDGRADGGAVSQAVRKALG
jgi:uncharacterized protein YqeY